MDIVQALQECCTNLCSKKIMERKRSADSLDRLLDNTKAIKILNGDNARVTWNDIVRSVHLYLVQESEKLQESQLKNVQRKKTSADLLVHAVQKANAGAVRLNGGNLVQYVIQCFDSVTLTKYYFNNYIIILKDYVLCQPQYLGCIAAEDWITLLNCLQKIALQAKFEDAKVAECIKLIFTYGPRHRLPLLHFRNQFDFVGKLCGNLERTAPTRYKAEVLQIVIEFCKSNAPDYCMSCCKLGESIFFKLHGLYERRVTDDCVKELLFEFCLLQIRLHHPHGVTNSSPEAYAYDWNEWRKQLRLIYRIVEEELNYYTKSTSKPQFLYQSCSAFVSMAVAVCKQVFASDADICIANSTTFDASYLDISQPSKRLKLDLGLEGFISCIKQSKNYLCIYIMTELLKVHPQITNFDQSMELLEILTGLYKEVKEINMQRCIYDCFTVLLEIQSNQFHERLCEMDDLWTFITDELLRSLTVHQNANSIHTLLQSLICKGKIKDPSVIYQTFLSGALILENYSIKTLSLALKHFGIPDMLNGEPCKKRIIKWMLCSDGNKLKVFAGDHSLFAQTLVSLCLKQYPGYVQDYDDSNKRSFEDIYALNAFQRLVIPDEPKMEMLRCTSISYHKEIYSELINSVKEFMSTFISVKYDLDYLQKSLSAVMLVGCVLSEVNALDMHEAIDALICKLCVEEVFQSINDILYYYCSDDSRVKSKLFSDTLKLFNDLLTKKFDPTVCKKYRSHITTNLLSCLFELLNSQFSLSQSEEDNDEEFVDNDAINDIKQTLINILCNFSMYRGNDSLTENENKVIAGLTQSSYEEHKMLVTVLSSIKHCQPGVINEEILFSIMESLQQIWTNHLTEYKNVLKVLEISYSLVHHIGSCKSEELNRHLYTLLNEIYNLQDKYGYKVSLALLDCFQLIFKDNFYINYRRYTNSCLSECVCKFLKSNYQLVRIKAIECLVTVFSKTFNDPSALSLQKSICGLIDSVSREVFVIEGKLDVERTIDENVSRTCSVFQTYATLSVCTSVWRKNFLYSLLAITQDKRLNVDLLKTALNLVVLKLGYKTANIFISEYVNFLLSQWYINQRTLASFPSEITGCESQLEFYKKYLKVIIPLHLNRNIEETEISKELGLSPKEIFGICFVELVTACFLRMVTKSLNNKEFDSANKLYTRITDELSETHVQELLIINIDNILINIMTSIIDEKLYEEQFDVEYVLENNEYPKSCVCEILNAIKEKAKIEKDLLEYCTNMYSEKIQSVLLHLTLNVYIASNALEKLKSLHQYLNFVDIITPFIIKSNCKMSDFCIRAVIYTILHFIEMECGTKSFNIAVCGYLHMFIKTTISNCHKKIEKYFSMIVNKLIPFISDKKLSLQSTTILKLLIVENEVRFKDIIPHLDPLPQINELRDINCIYKRLRTEKWGITLIGEINHFLEAADSLELGRLEALKHLKRMLAEKKSELKELFETASKVRDFSEERGKSIIHKLICMLVKLINSNTRTVCVEAACCLGEIGASDLTTLILQSEDLDVDQCPSPIQLLTSHLITLLYQSIVDPDIHVAKNASLVLYEVLVTKEGQHFIKNSESAVVSCLQPYLAKHQKFRSALVDTDNKHINTVNTSEIWWYTDNSHNIWITKLICAFLQYFPANCYLQSLTPLCKINVHFCEKLLPYVIHLYASMNDSNVRILSQWINYFFDQIWDLRSTGDASNSNQIPSIQCLLDAILFCRVHVKKLKSGYIFQLNYLKLAQAAFYCSRFFDAIFYVELWCQLRADNIPGSKKFIGSPLTLLDLVCGMENPSVCLAAQNILRRSYSAIGEVDGLNGCGHAFLLDASTRIDHYKELGRWDQVLLHYDTRLSQGKLNIKQDLVESLINCGYYALTMNYQEINSPDYDMYWRLGRYDCDTRQETDKPYEKHKYIALKSLLEKDKDIFSNAISKARSAVIDSYKRVNLQTAKALYGVLTNLQMVQELEDVSTMEFASLKKKWELQDAIPKIDFKSCEPIKAQRIALLIGFLNSPEFKGNISIEKCKEHLADLYLDLAESAREEKYFNIAKRAIASLSDITELKQEYSYKKVFVEAKICWDMGDKVTARYLIHELFTNNNNIKLNFVALKLYGQWMAETRSENPQTILNTYFLEPLKLMEGIKKEKEDFDNIFGTYYDIARFSDLEYQRIRGYVKSAEFEQKVHNKEKSKAAAEMIKSQAGMRIDEDQRRAAHIYHKQSVIDEAEIDSTLKEKGIYLLLAIKYYMLNLQYTDANNTRIFRVLSLWLENRNSDDLKKLLNAYVSKIPSYKFVPILPQLVPHLSNNSKEDFANHVASIIERCAKDHPHHTIPILQSLANSNMDEEYVKVNAVTDSNEVRVEGAQKLLKKLKSECSLKEIISEMELVSSAFLELAYLDRDKCKESRAGSNSYIIPNNTKMSKIRNLSKSYVPVITVDVNKDCQYKDVISVVSFNKEFMGVGGINRPKSILCQCSDGTTKRLLVKGKDDLRQDAVMEQVFTIMNDLFRNNKHTSKLLIRTYKVVPLSKRSGVIEWVENSQMIGEYLGRLHHKYRPGDWSTAKCQKKMKDAGGKSSKEKEKVFKEVCANFMPVMHNFFDEQYPHPSIWYERRRAYTHSLATTSISGYVLGLGDRHGGNILLDKSTAELIHIDFGIAFEQGKLLPTPETVPFRLTRDLEDGLGVTGVNGIFKRSCEKTMEVLRQNWETIISILDVLLYDPLYAWTITPAEAYSRQNYDDDSPRGSVGLGSNDKVNVNVTAERALLRLQQKLHGTEEGGSSSVEGQIEKLIQQARDPSNLSRLYFGWQAFL